MLWKFKKGNNTMETTKICSVYSQGVMTEWQGQNWFAKFCSGVLLEDEPRLGHSSHFNNKALKKAIHS